MAMGTKIADMTVGLHFDGSKMYVDMKQISKKAESEAANAGTKSGEKLSSKWAAATGVIAGITQTVFAKVTEVIGQSMDRAVKRVDTLNNFPKVMSNLGISADESKDVINSLAEKLNGLPTALDDAASAVQRFTSKNGDVKKSEQVFLAVNNAVLAGGANADIQSSAIEQLSQAYAKGKPDMMEWRTLQTAMPAQLKQVAQAMLGNTDALDMYMKKAQDYAAKNPMSSVGSELIEQLQAVKNGSGDMSTALGTALRAGIISMDEFTDTMVTMNEKGVDGFPSLKEQAQNATGGIGTAMENVQNRIAAAMQKIIDAIGQENIANAINVISSAISNIGSVIAGVINFIKDNEVARDILIASLITIALVITTAVVPAFIAWAAAMMANPITWIVLGITAVIAGIILLVTHLSEVGEWFGKVFGSIGEFIGAAAEQIGEFFGMIGEFIGTLAENIGNFFAGVAQAYWSVVQPIVDFIKNIIILVVAVFTNILTFLWNSILNPILNIVISIGTTIYNFISGIIGGIMNVIGGIVGWVSANVITPISSFFQGLFDWIGGAVGAVAGVITGIIGNIAGAIGAFANTVKGIFQGIADFVGGVFNAIGSFIGQVFNTIGGIIKAPINGIIQAINGVLSFINSIQVPDWVPGIGGAHTNFGMIPLLASGGVAMGASQAIIGEAGREVVLPLEQNTGNWSGLLAHALAEEMGNQGTTINEPIQVTINNNINNELDAREIGQVMMESIRRAAA